MKNSVNLVEYLFNSATGIPDFATGALDTLASPTTWTSLSFNVLGAIQASKDQTKTCKVADVPNSKDKSYEIKFNDNRSKNKKRGQVAGHVIAGAAKGALSVDLMLSGLSNTGKLLSATGHAIIKAGEAAPKVGSFINQNLTTSSLGSVANGALIAGNSYLFAKSYVNFHEARVSQPNTTQESVVRYTKMSLHATAMGLSSAVVAAGSLGDISTQYELGEALYSTTATLITKVALPVIKSLPNDLILTSAASGVCGKIAYDTWSSSKLKAVGWGLASLGAGAATAALAYSKFMSNSPNKEEANLPTPFEPTNQHSIT